MGTGSVQSRKYCPRIKRERPTPPRKQYLIFYKKQYIPLGCFAQDSVPTAPNPPRVVWAPRVRKNAQASRYAHRRPVARLRGRVLPPAHRDTRFAKSSSDGCLHWRFSIHGDRWQQSPLPIHRKKNPDCGMYSRSNYAKPKRSNAIGFSRCKIYSLVRHLAVLTSLQLVDLSTLNFLVYVPEGGTLAQF